MSDQKRKFNWTLGAASALAIRPCVIGASYFGWVEVEGVWGDMPAPQWAIQKETMQAYFEKLKRQ